MRVLHEQLPDHWKRIVQIEESPLNSRSMPMARAAPTDPLDESSAETASVSANRESRPVTNEHAARALEYYARVNLERYDEGPACIQEVMRRLYEDMVDDSSWSPSARNLFRAIQHGTPVAYSRLRQKGSVVVDLARAGSPLSLRGSDCVVVEIRANSIYYWQMEKDLHEYARTHDLGVTTADPGSARDFRTRFEAAGRHDDLGPVEVRVRRLRNGECEDTYVRPVEKFVLERGAQRAFVQNAYEMFAWHWSIRGHWVDRWKRATDKKKVERAYAKKLNLHIRTHEELLQIIGSFSYGSTSDGERMSFFGNFAKEIGGGKLSKVQKDTPEAPATNRVDRENDCDDDTPREEVAGKKKREGPFDRFYKANKAPGVLKEVLKRRWANMSDGEKTEWGAVAKQKKPGVSKKRKIVPTERQTHAEPKEPTDAPKDPTDEPKEPTPDPKEPTPDPKEPTPDPKEPTDEQKEPNRAKRAKESTRPDLAALLSEYFETSDDENVKFVWRLFVKNLKKTEERGARRTVFEKTPFSQARAIALEDKDAAAALRHLRSVPGIATSFQAFNVLFSNLLAEQENDDEEYFS